MDRQSIAMLCLVVIFAAYAQWREYKQFANICATHIPNNPIAFEYSLVKSNVAGTFNHDELKIRIGINGKKVDREYTLWHELGHAITFYIHSANRTDIAKLFAVFEQNSLFLGECTGYNWNFSYVSKYACTNILEDVAETYAAVMSDRLQNNYNKKIDAKVDAMCELFRSYDIACDA